MQLDPNKTTRVHDAARRHGARVVHPQVIARVSSNFRRPIERLGHHQLTAQNRSTASATALATVALRAGDESTCSSARLTIIPASRSTAGIRDSYSTAILSEAS